MINIEKYNLKLDEVKNRLSRFEKKNRISNVLLFRDYLRKLDECKIRLGGESDKIFLSKGKKFHNVFLLIKSSWSEQMKTQQDFNNDLRDMKNIDLKGGRFHDDLFVYLYFCWEVYGECIEIKETSLSNPYEPVMRIIERSEFIYSHSGNIIIDDVTINNLEKYYHFQMPSLEYDFLDYIDEIFTSSGASYGGIPNQEKTNQLWEEFQKIKKNG